ncbi:hypothetical protein BJX76DRAFT_323853, partial [Aspergillus varians]
MTQKLTTHLPTTTPHSLHSATTHPFLRLAGSGQIPKPLLSQWLSQDRLYAQSYVRFIGLLLAKVHLPRTPTRTQTPPKNDEAGAEGNDNENETIHEKILTILVSALTNIHTELRFFETVALEYGLDLNAPAAPTTAAEELDGQKGFETGPVTQGYIDMFMSAGSSGTSLLEGLVVLWATEVCYLKAWRFARSFLASGENKEGGAGDMDGGALRERFIPNWASEEFEVFVKRIGDVVDELGEVELAPGRGGKGELGRCERWWRQVVWLEERFWPVV